ncbi:molybdopterin cofactor-binding domain-containing protein [Brucella sp. BE17]|uniref:xanthine dehydrogenase family protein molybdopterin-binding subunit n=1 Tax=Brucella sp. BE17 TaxID=3142977 RepID=UPI0031BB25D3
MQHTSISSRKLSRRSFLISAGAIGVAVSFGSLPVGLSQAQNAASDTAGFRPNAWVSIAGDGTVTIVCPASEMGQGAMTVLPLLIAEDMDADWDRVKIIQAPADAGIYGNPGRGGRQLTGGSETVTGYYEFLRLVGAQARLAILQSAAVLMGVPARELTTTAHIVVHSASGRTLGYGEIAASGSIPDELPQVTPADLKPIASCRYIGIEGISRVDIPAKVDGSAVFGIDVQLPDMLFGTILRAPVAGEIPEDLDAAEAMDITGVVRIVTLDYGIGVIAETFEAAMQARDMLRVTWSNGSRMRDYSTDEALENYAVIGRDLAQSGVEQPSGNEVATAISGASTVISAEFRNEHVYHATMEPMTATAIVNGDMVEVWAPTQGPVATRDFAARAANTTPDKVNVHTTLIGGGFGRKAEGDFITDAVLLAREVQGRAVKVIWSREEDVRHCKFRPLVAQHIRVGVDDTGHITGWQHRIVADSIFARTVPVVLENAGGMDSVVIEGAHLNYAIAASQIQYLRQDSGQDVGFWRGVGVGYTRFAVETVIDEIAATIDKDPLDYRLELLAAEPRARRVIETVREMAGWGRELDGRALGLAYSDVWAHCAQVAEVSLDQETGEIRVHNVWCAVDAGVAVQPRNIEAQIMGAIIHGASHALFEQIGISNGEVQEANFDTYRVMRMSEAPEIHIQIIQSTENPPSGIGEVGLPPVAPAIANAIARLTGGTRLRHMPFVPERVLLALGR